LNRRDKATLKKAAISLKAETGAKVEIADFGVTDGEAVRQAVSAIERDIGAIDIMINNAGMQFR
jgi:gluconate 5-dehydrogenase